MASRKKPRAESGSISAGTSSIARVELMFEQMMEIHRASTERMDAFQARMDRQAGNHDARMEALELRMTHLERRVAVVEQKMDLMIAQMHQNTSDVRDLRRAVDALNDTAKRIEVNAASKAEVAALERRIAALEQRAGIA